MRDGRISEQDWKLFRKLLPEWQEAYMERLICSYLELLNGPQKASDKFWALEERLRKDQHDVGVQARMSRSMALLNLVALVREGVITMADLEPFSEELREAIQLILSWDHA